MDEPLVDAIVATRRTIAELQAVEEGLYAMALRGALADRAPGSGSDMPVRSIAAEIGAAIRVSDRVVQRRLDEAHELIARFPATYAAFCEGGISRAHVTAIIRPGSRLEDADARADYEAMAVAVAERESAGRLTGIAKLLAERILPRRLDERHADAAADRGVWVTDLDDGMAELRMLLPAVLAHWIIDRLTRMAHAMRQTERDGSAEPAADGLAPEAVTAQGCADMDLGDDPVAVPTVADAAVVVTVPVAVATDAVAVAADDRGDARSLNQARADLLADLALTADPSCDDLLGAIHAEVLVTVPVLTLAGRAAVDGAASPPAMLDGAIPIDPHTARRLAGGAPGWDRVLTHPITSGVLAVDRYRPSAELRRFLRATDERCRFPCCRLPVARCDLDHLHEASRGGATDETNLADECRRHHVIRHAAGWRVAKAKDGVVLWTSPTGRVYPDHPPGVVFRPADPDPSRVGGGRDAPF